MGGKRTYYPCNADRMHIVNNPLDNIVRLSYYNGSTIIVQCLGELCIQIR